MLATNFILSFKQTCDTKCTIWLLRIWKPFNVIFEIDVDFLFFLFLFPWHTYRFLVNAIFVLSKKIIFCGEILLIWEKKKNVFSSRRLAFFQNIGKCFRTESYCKILPNRLIFSREENVKIFREEYAVYVLLFFFRHLF